MAQVNGNGNGHKKVALLSEADTMGILSSSSYLDQLVPIIKTHLKNNSIGELLETLQGEAAKTDDRLAKTINDNQDKISLSATDIAGITKNAASMNEQILDINDHLAKTSNMTFEKKFQLLALKKNISKIHESEILINKILQVLELTDKTHELVKNDKFFQALKSLNDLNSLSKEFDRDFIFLNNINASVPILKNLIRDESLSLLKKRLGGLELKFEPLGQACREWFAMTIARFKQFKTTNKEFEDYKVNSPVEVSVRGLYLGAESTMPDQSDFINTGFIHDTLLIFKTLNQTDFLRMELNKEMNLRRDKIFYPFISSDSKNEAFGKYIRDPKNLQSFLDKLSGYLMFHKSISDKLPSIITMKTNDLWENLSAKIYPHLKNLVMNEILESGALVQVKQIIGNFYLTLEHLQFNTDHIYNVLVLSFKKYNQIIIHLFGKEFRNTAQEDDATPMSIFDLKLYKKISHVCWYKDERPDNELTFPLMLPFSAVYPMSCAQTRNFVANQTDFLDAYFKYDLNSLNRFIVENVDHVLLEVIDKHFEDLLGDSLSTEELAQNLINLEYFLIMSKEMSKFLSDKYEVPITLKAVDAFSETRKKTEESLFAMLDNKILDLLEMADWDWQTKHVNNETSDFITDMGFFLRNLFHSTLMKLPLSIRTLLLYRVFDLLAGEFMKELQAQPAVTKAALTNFDIDISYIENITRELNPTQTSRPGTNRESLLSMFLQLRQRINLMKIGHLEEYKDQPTRMRQFDQIKPDEAVQLVNKLRD
ncbi:Exocyst complex component SEC15 [Cyberlindnera fabianii]|uniref:Exocyst complex component SEC15 n=1 Tax=Cyberlindnera fabianii TaxID=36022 RepID=A0A1V2LBQ5_CYBFA|nr:Exocyst complex component SEC15 [Cyberlindnera fabianii]